MPGNFMKEDLRIIKTYRALMDSMTALLEKRNFNQITVNDICEYAQISRTTFYTHFNDKYDLLRNWLFNEKAEFHVAEEPIPQIQAMIESFVVRKVNITKNILEDANGETVELLHMFMISLLGENPVDAVSPLKWQVLSVFFAGGAASYLSWHVKNKMPNPQSMNRHFNELVRHMLKSGDDTANQEATHRG